VERDRRVYYEMRLPSDDVAKVLLSGMKETYTILKF